MTKNKTFNFASLLISLCLLPVTCLAETAPAVGQTSGSPFGTGLIFIVIIVMMYFFMIRPQNKRAKEHRELLQKLSKGDEVLTSGGMLGKIDKITDTLVVIEVSNGVRITLQKQAIAASLPKGTIKSID